MMSSILTQAHHISKLMKHGNGLSSSKLNGTQPEWHQQTNEEVMGELARYNKTVVCACALEPITVA